MIRYCSGLSSVGLPEHQLVEEALVLLRAVGLGIGIADEIGALRAVAVDDGEADAVEREADAAPRAVEAVVDDELARAARFLLEPRALGPGGGAVAACTAAVACGLRARRSAPSAASSISASRPGSGGITAHTKPAGERLSICVVGTCSAPRCEM